MLRKIPRWVLRRLVADPSLQFLHQKFVCTKEPSLTAIGESSGYQHRPIPGKRYTLIEIRYTVHGFVGNFDGLPPSTSSAGIDLRCFMPVSGPHPNELLQSAETGRLTRARFGTAEHSPPELNLVRYGWIKRAGDELPVCVYNFDPLLLEHPPSVRNL